MINNKENIHRLLLKEHPINIINVFNLLSPFFFLYESLTGMWHEMVRINGGLCGRQRS